MNSDMLRAAVIACALGLGITTTAVKCAGCQTHSVDLEGVRSALDLGGVAIDKAYELAVKACLERERLEIAEERDGKQAPSETDAAIARIRGDCNRVRTGFDALRDVHGEAAAAYERGDIAAARDELERVKQRWRALTATTDGGAP